MVGVNLYLLETIHYQCNFLMSEYLGFIFNQLSQGFRLVMYRNVFWLVLLGLQTMVFGLALPSSAPSLIARAISDAICFISGRPIP